MQGAQPLPHQNLGLIGHAIGQMVLDLVQVPPDLDQASTVPPLPLGATVATQVGQGHSPAPGGKHGGQLPIAVTRVPRIVHDRHGPPRLTPGSELQHGQEEHALHGSVGQTCCLLPGLRGLA